MRTTVLILAAAGLVAAGDLRAQPDPADSAAIVATALDYIEGYYEGDGDRMARALHPELAKRIVRTDADTGESRLGDMDDERLVEITRSGAGTRIPAERRRQDVEILDIFGSAASVRIDAGGWIDYLHLARWNGEWKIVNVLWELRPEGR